MDCLSDKSTRDYNYTSRYSPFYYYYNSFDDKYMYGTTGQLSLDTEYVIHSVNDYDTLDSLALKYYGRPDLFWVIADFNRIQDSFINLKESGFNNINIPSIAGIKYLK